MKIITRAVYDIETMNLLECEGFDYPDNLPIEHCGGGPSAEQKQQAQATTARTAQEDANAQKAQQFAIDQQNKVNPFYTQRMEGGLPFYGDLTDSASGTNAQAFAPAHAALERQLSGFGGALPSGFAEQARTDLNTQQAKSYDSNITNNLMMNEQAKQQGAAGLQGQAQAANPLGWYGAAQGGSNAIFGAPLQKPGIGGILGSFAGGAAKAAMM